MKEKEEHCCSCGHNHEGGHSISYAKRLIFSIIFIILVIFTLRPFLFNQVFKRGCAYITYNIYDDAIRQYKKAVFLNRQSNDSWNWLGYSYKSKGDIKKAIGTYKAAIKVNPNNVIARFDLGMIYLINKDFSNAAECFRYVVAMGKENAATSPLDIISYHHSSCRMLIACYEKMGEKEQMVCASRITLKFYPDDKKVKDKLLQIEGMPK